MVRVVQHSGREDSWTPARRASASFLAQSGRLVGLTDIRRGMVLDLTPSLTSRTSGSEVAGAWEYEGGSPELGGTVRWGLTNNLTLNGTFGTGAFPASPLPAFGQVTAVNDPRVLQIALRLHF